MRLREGTMMDLNPLISKLRLPPDHEIEGRDDDGFEPPDLNAKTTTRP